MKCQMLSPWENKKKKKKKKKKYGMTKLLHRALAHLFDCVKISILSDKRDRALVKHYKMFFSLLLICLTLKYFICSFLIKRMLGFKV